MDYITTSQLENWYKTSLGRAVRSQLKPLVRDCLDPRLVNVVVGFGKPYLNPKDPVLMLNPGTQGTSLWGTPNKTALVDCYSWPLPDCSVDRLILLHSCEFMEDPSAFLKEVHRVLTPHGLVILFSPRIWFQTHQSLDIRGHNFSLNQVRKLFISQSLDLVAHRAVYFKHFSFPSLIAGAYHGLCGRKQILQPSLWTRKSLQWGYAPN